MVVTHRHFELRTSELEVLILVTNPVTRMETQVRKLEGFAGSATPFELTFVKIGNLPFNA